MTDPSAPTLQNSTLLKFARAALTRQTDAPDTPNIPWEEFDLTDSEQRSFGDYELIEMLGRGGMGVVYRAHHKRLQRDVAIKFIASGYADDALFIAKFLEEARASAKLHHPNIVPIFEVGSVDCLHYFTMPLMRGRTLADLNLGRQGYGDIVALMQKLCSAVTYAHSLGMLHLDLKPVNVMIDEHGQPLIGDFGLARQMDDTGSVTANEVSGTPAFMAPEQVQIKQYRLTERTDVYALGAILFRLLTGESAHGRGQAQELMQNAVAGRINSVRSLNPMVDKDLAAICEKCLQLLPRDRYHSAAAMAQDLSRYQDGNSVSVRQASLFERTRRAIHRNPTIAAASIAAVLALMMGFMATTWQWRQAEAARTAAEAQRVLADDRATQMAKLAEMIAVVHPESRNAADVIHDPAYLLVSWLNENGGKPEQQRELLTFFIEALKKAGKERALDDLLYEIPAQMGRDYRQSVGAKLAEGDERDDLLAAALLLLPRQGKTSDSGLRDVVQTIDARYGDDPLALIVLTHACGFTELECNAMNLRERLRSLAPDSMLAWTYGFEEKMDGAALQAMAEREKLSDGLYDMSAIIYRKVGSHRAPETMTVPLQAFLSPEEAAAFASGDVTFLPIPPVTMLMRPCNPTYGWFEASFAEHCVRIGQTLLYDEYGTVLSRNLGSTILRRLAKGTPDEERAYQFRRQYVWILEQTRNIGELVPPTIEFARQWQDIGEWPAYLRWAESLGIAPEPPEDWVPEDDEALLLNEDRPSRQ